MEVGGQRAHNVLLVLLDHAPQRLQLLDPELQRAGLARAEGRSGPLHDLADFAHGAWGGGESTLDLGAAGVALSLLLHRVNFLGRGRSPPGALETWHVFAFSAP